jgi:hypothetical protein
VDNRDTHGHYIHLGKRHKLPVNRRYVKIADTLGSIYGEAAVTVNKEFEKTFFSQSKTFMAGPIPVTISAGVTGKLALALSYSVTESVSLTPSAGLYATVSAGVGYSSKYLSAQAGIKGELTLIELSLPITLSISNIGSAPRWTVQGDLTLKSLSGALKLFAEAKVKVWVVEVGVEYSYKIIDWTGVELTRTLFSESGSF